MSIPIRITLINIITVSTTNISKLSLGLSGVKKERKKNNTTTNCKIKFQKSVLNILNVVHCCIIIYLNSIYNILLCKKKNVLITHLHIPNTN